MQLSSPVLVAFLTLAAGTSTVACVSDETAGPATPSGSTADAAGTTTSIEVVDAPEKLTSNPSDRLFRIKLTGGPSLDPTVLGAFVKFPAGSSGTFRETVLQESDGNQRLDVGDSLLILEGSRNVFSEAFATQSAEVSLVRYAKDDPPSGQTLATGTWKAD